MVPGDAFEQADDAGDGGSRQGVVLGADRQVRDPALLHGLAQGAFDECGNRQGDELAGEQSLDAGRVMKPRGRDMVLLSFAWRLVESGPELVGSEQLRVGEGAVACNHGPHVVGGGVVGDLGRVDLEAHSPVAAQGLSEAGVGSGTTALLLPVGLLDALADGEAGCVDPGKFGVQGIFDGRQGLQPASG